MKKYVKILLTMMLLLIPIYCDAQTYYVDSSAGGGGDGSAEKPFVSIQRAADIVNPGDVVLVRPGIYFEQVKLTRCGTKEQPITFRALDMGEYKTIISGANRRMRQGEMKWTLEDEELQLYSVPWENNVSMLLYNGARANGYRLLDELKEFRGWNNSDVRPADGGVPGAKHGFCWVAGEKKLYIRLHPEEKYGSLDPNKNVIAISGPYYETATNLDGTTDNAFRNNGIGQGSYNFGVVTGKETYVNIEGFTFETPGWAGVFCHGHNINIVNCYFRGCMTAVRGGRHNAYEKFVAKDIVIDHCDWHMWPIFVDSEEICEEIIASGQPALSMDPTWFAKAWRGSIHDEEAGGFVTCAGNGWTLSNNYIHDAFEGLSYAFTFGVMQRIETTNICVDNGKNIKIFGNRFERLWDNAIEFENHGSDIDVYDNEFIDILEPLSVQSGSGFPLPTNIYVHNNMFWSTDEFGNMILEAFTEPRVHFLKYGFSDWSSLPNMRAYPWSGDNGYPIRPVWLQDKGIWIYNNYIEMNNYIEHRVGYLTNGPNTQISDITDHPNNSYLYNNIFYCWVQPKGRPFRTFLLEGEFLSHDYSNAGFKSSNNIFIPINLEDDKYEVDFIRDTPMGKAYESLEEAGIIHDGYGKSIYLAEDSVARGAGIQIELERRDTTDIGPIPYGEKWEIDYGTFVYGDINGDDMVTDEDEIMLSEMLGRKASQTEKPSKYDLSLDGFIDEMDLEIIKNLNNL